MAPESSESDSDSSQAGVGGGDGAGVARAKADLWFLWMCHPLRIKRTSTKVWKIRTNMTWPPVPPGGLFLGIAACTGTV